ncbi:MAG TPA: PmoA family protein [Candidatus Paceibacterota bacterium]|nr:PmoA family protein [Verrucomicrobiota bacterium]HSA11048.1 PmoA family protein [Candidatus Paceibacterota bacterium]
MHRKPALPYRRFAFGLALLLALAGAASAANPAIAIDSKAAQGELEIQFKGRKLLVYAFATNQFKPYVRELYTLRGENVLRDAPPDHLHHHGLMYAVHVNGINFWEEHRTPGIQKHVELVRQSATVDAKGVPEAQFTELIHWLGPTNRGASDSLAAAVLVERRTLWLSVDEAKQEVALRWDGQFQVGPNAGRVTIRGANYTGLGLRLPESFNHVAKFQNSEGLPYHGPNTQNVIAARWTSVSGALNGHEGMLVLFGSTDSRRFFFTMLDPFAYLSVTQGLDKQPLEYGPGDKFSVSYLLTVYSETRTTEFIRRRCDQWDKERK